MESRYSLRSPACSLGSLDFVILFILTTASFFMRFWLIQHPDAPVFDEVHFGNFTNWYSLSQYYFDIHPNLGKLLAFYLANLSEYDGQMKFANIPSGRYTDVAYVGLRVHAGFFSALCMPLIYLTVRFTGFSILAATTASVLALADTSLATEGRFILSDGYLHFFTCLHTAVLSYAFRIADRGGKWYVWHILNGLTLGAAFSVKNTAQGLAVLDAFVYIIDLLPLLEISMPTFILEVILKGSTLLATALSVYFVSFGVHFIVLPYGGQGYGYLPEDMKAQLIQNPVEDGAIFARRIVGPSLFMRTLRLSWIMHTGNMGIAGFHGSQSRPFNWPLLTGIDVGFWGDSHNQIKCHGNVFSYYLALAGVIMCLVSYKHPQYLIGLRFAVGWAFSYFPFYLIPRTLYLYHYLIPLMLGCMAFGAGLDMLCKDRVKGVIAVLSMALALLGFYVWMPFVYGKYTKDLDFMIWNENWRHGDKAYKLARELNNKKKTG